MTDCALAAPTTPASMSAITPATTGRATATPRRGRRSRPVGVPRWAWLFGVTVIPLDRGDPEAPQAWVLSAGGGTTHTAALFHDDPDADR